MILLYYLSSIFIDQKYRILKYLNFFLYFYFKIFDKIKAMDTNENNPNYDVIVCGTGLIECILSGLLCMEGNFFV
jgi:hypothetical protein